MQTLQERLEEREAEHKRFIRAEYIVDAVHQHISDTIQPVTAWVNTTWGNHNFKAESCEQAELEIIPFISKTFATKWTKSVNERKIAWSTSFRLNGFHHYFEVTYYFTESCSIKKIPTGRTVRESVYVDAPEFEYQVDCG